ncbi:hypothetical protein NKH77_20555 [Streptomyces sp. M19]
MGSGLADYVTVHASRVWSVGDTEPAVAAMGEPLACVVHSCTAAASAPGTGSR